MSSKGQLVLWYFIAFVFIVITIFASLSTIGIAAHEDFIAFSQYKEINLCSCGLSSETITLKNTGDVTSVYEITQEGDASKWSTLSQARFILNPGEKQDIKHFVKVPCSAEGSFKLSINIKTIFETQKAIEQEIKVGRCNNIGLVPVKNLATSCPAKPMLFEFILANTGAHPEVYSINAEIKGAAQLNMEADKALRALSISEKEIFLMPKQKKKVLVFAQMAAGIYGKADYNLIVTARNNGLKVEVPFSLIINKCYDYTISIPSNIRFCSEFENILPVEIANNAELYNSYLLNAEILDQDNRLFEAYDLGEYLLPPKGKQNINSVLPVGSEPGEYYLSVDAVSVLGEIERYVEAPLEITYCNDNGIPLSEEEYNSLQEEIEEAEYGEEQETEEERAEQEEETKTAETEEAAEGTAIKGTKEAEEISDPVALYVMILILFVALGILGIVYLIKRKNKQRYGIIPDFLAMPPEAPSKKAVIKEAGMKDAGYGDGRKERKKRMLLIGITGAVFFIVLALVVVMVIMMAMPADVESTESEETAQPVQPAETAEKEKTAGKKTGKETAAETGEEETEEGLTALEYITGMSLLLFLLLIIVASILVIIKLRRRKKAKEAKNEKAGKKTAKKAEEEDDYFKTDFKTRIKDLTERKEKRKRNWKKIILWSLVPVLAVLLILGGIATFMALTKEAANKNVLIGQLSREEMANNGILDIEGKTITVEKGKEAKIPLVFRNEEAAEKIVDLDFDIPWLKTEGRELTLKKSDEEKSTITISEEAPEGKYKIIFQIKDEKDGEKIVEENIYINVIVPATKIIKTIAIASIASLIFAAIFIVMMILLIKRRKRKNIESGKTESKAKEEKKETKEEIKKREAKEKAEKTIPALTKEELELKARKKEERKAKLKRFAKNASFILLILIIIGLVGLGIYALSSHYEKQQPDIERVGTLEIETEAPLRYTISDITKLTLIPFKITNKNPSFSYEITVENSEDWISFDREKLEVKADSHEMLEMKIDPNKTKEGAYNLKIRMIQKEDSEKIYNNELYVNINKRGFLGTVRDALKAYWLYLLLGISGLAVIIILITVYYRRERKQSLQELAKEAMDKNKGDKGKVMPQQAQAPQEEKQKRKYSKYKFKKTNIKLD